MLSLLGIIFVRIGRVSIILNISVAIRIRIKITIIIIIGSRLSIGTRTYWFCIAMCIRTVLIQAHIVFVLLCVFVF